MTALAHVAILAYLLLGVVLFRYFPGHRLVIGVYVLGVLFLPELGSAEFVEGVPKPLHLPGLDLTKPNAIALGLLAGSLLFDRRRWLGVRFRWFDVPVLAWCVGPFVSSAANGLYYGDAVGGAGASGGAASLYDGVVRSLDVIVSWGAPYWLGRVYVTDSRKLADLVGWMIAGAVLYVPLCLLETRLSPQLHRWVYGFHQHEFLQAIRFGGYRPMVFLEHGLAVGFWMVACALAAGWLWLAGRFREVRLAGRRADALLVLVPLAVTAVACKSTGALALGALGFAVLVLARVLRSPAPALVLLAAFPLYAGSRALGVWDAHGTVGYIAAVVGDERAASLEFRLWNEEMLVDKAMQRPLVGWGGWGRSKVYDAYGKPVSIADGLWVVTLGERGLLGLVTLGFVLLLPVGMVVARHGPRLWTDPGVAPAAVAAVILGIYSIDCLMNAMLNPVFLLLSGGLIALPRHDPAVQSSDGANVRTGWRIRPPRAATRLTKVRVPSRVTIPAGGRMPGNGAGGGTIPPQAGQLPLTHEG